MPVPHSGFEKPRRAAWRPVMSASTNDRFAVTVSDDQLIFVKEPIGY